VENLVEPRGAELPGCSITIKCANDPLIERCLDSIDDDVSVHAVITPSEAIEAILRARGIPFTRTDYGNIAKSCEIGVNEAEHDNIIVMDSDSSFAPGSIRRLREALQHYPLARGKVQILGNTAMSEMIAKRRQVFYDCEDFTVNPGLALRRDVVREHCGGFVFNPLVRWTEDADLNFRARQAGLKVGFVPESVILHDPVALKHELRTAFLYGVGKRLSVEHTPDRQSVEGLWDITVAAFKGLSPRSVISKLREYGPGVMLLERAWRVLYLAGYHAQKHTGRWSVQGADARPADTDLPVPHLS